MLVEKISMVDALNMEMKELMDSEENIIIQALENASSGYVGDLWGDTLELIYRLKNEVSQYRSSYEHIDAVHTSDFEHFSKTVNEQKAEIERLTIELAEERIKGINSFVSVLELKQENTKLQKQVDELKERLQFAEEAWEEDCDPDLENFYEQIIKGTAKEIYQEIGDSDILVVKTKEYGEIEVVSIERLKEIIKSKGVEVE